MQGLKMWTNMGLWFPFCYCLFVSWDRISSFSTCFSWNLYVPYWFPTQLSTCLCLLSSVIKGEHYHCPGLDLNILTSLPTIASLCLNKPKIACIILHAHSDITREVEPRGSTKASEQHRYIVRPCVQAAPRYWSKPSTSILIIIQLRKAT